MKLFFKIALILFLLAPSSSYAEGNALYKHEHLQLRKYAFDCDNLAGGGEWVKNYRLGIVDGLSFWRALSMPKNHPAEQNILALLAKFPEKRDLKDKPWYPLA